MDHYCFYRWHTFLSDPPGGGQSKYVELCTGIRVYVSRVDHSFASVSIDSLLREVLSLYFELFSVAWVYKFGDKQAVAQSAVTMQYLNVQGRSDIWARMEPYNQAVFEACNYDVKTYSVLGKGAIGKGYRALEEAARKQDFERYCNEGFDPTCVARALNRDKMGVKVAWMNHAMHSYLVEAFCKQLGCPPLNQEARNVCATWIDSLYKSFCEDMDRATIVG
jgi:hypothetical protein